MAIPNQVEAAIWTLLRDQCPAMWLGFPIGIGHVYWVNHFTGLDTNIGTKPTEPFETITYALTQCLHNRNDYIMVLDSWDNEPAFPIVVDVDRVHIIGLSNPTNLYPKINPGALVPAAVFQLGDGTHGQYCEIANFDIMGDGVHGCIECNQARGGWIHHCWFGHDEAGGGLAPDYGIWLAAGNSEGLLVEDCRFFGWDKLALTVLTYGIFADALGVHRGDYAQYRRNIFQTCRTAGIYFEGDIGSAIVDNIFACVADVQGSAITLAAGGGGVCAEGVVSGNKALFGLITAGMANNPYLDQNVAPTILYSWMANYKGNVLIDPA